MKPTAVVTLVALALALVAVAVFWGARDNEFVWDDPIVFQQQLPYFDSFSNVFFPPRNARRRDGSSTTRRRSSGTRRRRCWSSCSGSC
ncbi:MAG: hypothetical protein H6Q01_1026 [Acidobacteria bacterium]|nr:hypothetical protein [Acidobacteriota bacterium]